MSEYAKFGQGGQRSGKSASVMSNKQEPIKFSEIKSGMSLWDKKEDRIAKVLRVELWDNILKENPNRYFKKEKK